MMRNWRLDLNYTTQARISLTELDDIVQLLHQTVREFLLRKDGLASPFDTDDLGDHSEIIITCVRYLEVCFLMDNFYTNAN